MIWSMDHWCYYSFLLTTCLWKLCMVLSLNFYMKDFMQSQGRRLKFQLKQYGSLESIFSDLSMPFKNGNVGSSSVVASDIVSVGDSWLSYAIRKSIIQPIEGVEDQEWFKGLSTKWKVSIQLFFFSFPEMCSTEVSSTSSLMGALLIFNPWNLVSNLLC